MLERMSALAGIEPLELDGLRISEARGFLLLQVARPSKAITADLGRLPESVGIAVVHAGHAIMKIGSARYWVSGPSDSTMPDRLNGKAMLTPISHSRTRILLEGEKARAVLARSAPLDFSPAAFKLDNFAMTGIHHTPVLIHRTGEQAFHIYAMRTFALSVWEWLVDAGNGLD